MKDRAIVSKIWIFQFFNLLKKRFSIFKESFKRQIKEFNDSYQKYRKENYYDF